MCIFNDSYKRSPIDDSTTDIPICAAESQDEKVLLETLQSLKT